MTINVAAKQTWHNILFINNLTLSFGPKGIHHHTKIDYSTCAHNYMACHGPIRLPFPSAAIADRDYSFESSSLIDWNVLYMPPGQFSLKDAFEPQALNTRSISSDRPLTYTFPSRLRIANQRFSYQSPSSQDRP